MKKNTLFLIFGFIFLLTSCDFIVSFFEDVKRNSEEYQNSEKNDSQNIPSNNSQNKKMINQYFWGTWINMASGKTIKITDTDIKIYNYGSYYYDYGDITDTTSDSIICHGGNDVFIKESKNVMKNNNIPYFREYGSDIEYKAKLVGFSSIGSSRAATFTDFSKINVNVSVKDYPSYSQNVNPNSDGTIVCVSPISNSENILSIKNNMYDESESIDVSVKPINNGENVGTIPIPVKDMYSLKVTGKIIDNYSEEDQGYLYSNRMYKMRVKISNVSDIKSRPGTYTISANDDFLSVNGDTYGILQSFTKGSYERTFDIDISCRLINKPFIDTSIKVRWEDADFNVWDDYIPLRFFKEKVLLSISTYSKNNSSLNCFVMYPDGNCSYHNIKGRKEIYIPSFYDNNKYDYKLAFSGASSTGYLSDSTETMYAIKIGDNAPFLTGFESAKMSFIDLVNNYEPNESEDTAWNIQDDLHNVVYGYIEDSEVDFFKFNLEMLY